MKPRTQPQKATNNKAPNHIRVTSFETVSFFDQKEGRTVVILYSLGEDGVIREFVGGKWNPFPVTE